MRGWGSLAHFAKTNARRKGRYLLGHRTLFSFVLLKGVFIANFLIWVCRNLNKKLWLRGGKARPSPFSLRFFSLSARLRQPRALCEQKSTWVLLSHGGSEVPSTSLEQSGFFFVINDPWNALNAVWSTFERVVGLCISLAQAITFTRRPRNQISDFARRHRLFLEGGAIAKFALSKDLLGKTYFLILNMYNYKRKSSAQRPKYNCFFVTLLHVWYFSWCGGCILSIVRQGQ